MHGIAERTTESRKRNLDAVTIFQLDAGSETQAVSAEEVYVDVPGSTVPLKLEVMVLQVS